MKRIVLARDPDGSLTEDNFRLEEVEAPVPSDGEFLIRSVLFGLEPRQRTVMTPASVTTKSRRMSCGSDGTDATSCIAKAIPTSRGAPPAARSVEAARS